MATLIGGTALSRRLTQLFSDNKKSYEALVQTPQTGPELSPLHLKLKIQKDRLVAWGIQWSDRSAAASGEDIDRSLDKAGIGDLVASIMSSIRELLDEAEMLLPRAIPRTMTMPMPMPMPSAAGKAALAAPQEWTTANLKRLEEILKDLTTSIDTLCDLSRPRMEVITKQDAPPSPTKMQRLESVKSQGSSSIRPISMDMGGTRNSSPARRDDLTDMAYIDPSLLRLRAVQSRSSSSPPSYESVAAGSENRVLAYFSLPSARPKRDSNGITPPSETAVLLDYRQDTSPSTAGMPRPDNARFEEILLALLKFSTWKANTYTGILKLTGWTIDRPRTRYAYAYEIPRPIEGNEEQFVELQPRSLLSFLQNGGDADANNIPSLENRYRLALNIALSLMRLHEVNVTHRNINSGNILFFVDKAQASHTERIWKGPVIRKPYLTGLHQLSARTATYDRESPFSGIYYHPSLTGPTQITYELVHDYYSLGLILLEIGLWMPIGKFWKSKYTIPDFKSRLQDIYMRKLSAKCGDAYMQAVLYCMTAADESTVTFETQSADEQQYAAAFQQNVVRALERCCRIDGELISDEIIEAFAGDLPPEHEGTAKEASPGPEMAVKEPLASDERTVMDTKPVRTAPVKQAKFKVWSHDIPELYTNYWNSTMLPRLEKILRKALSRWESYTIDLFMAGEHPDTARPTIFMECTSTAKVRKILRHLNKDLRLFEIKVVPGQITRSKAAKKKRSKGQSGSGGYNLTGTPEDLNPHYQPQPGCGASIGAYLNGAHLPPVTFGGAILVDGEPYGMSVHHMLEDDEQMQLALDDSLTMHRSMAPRQPARKGDEGLQSLESQFSNLYPFEVSEPAETEETSSTGYAYSDVSGPSYTDNYTQEAMYPYELPAEEGDPTFDENFQDDDLDEFWLDPNFETASTVSDEDEEVDMGDTDGVHPGNGLSLFVTQPALDDVRDGFFPCAEDAPSEHLASHGLGHIHASSGLRRARSDTLVHEIDWALIKIHELRLPHHSEINNRPASPAAVECPPPTSILPSDSLAARRVHSHARSYGLFARGTILPSMRLVRMPGRISPSHSWQVKGNFGSGGDSGAWVFDDATGAVCGHVLAYSESSGVAYIAPMDVMFKDMERVLGQSIQLPGSMVAEGLHVEMTKRGEAVSPIYPTSPPVVPKELDLKARERTVIPSEEYRNSVVRAA